MSNYPDADIAKVSVVVPVYNAESSLGRCVDSILNQTYSDLQVILVDDGSTDASPIICDAYARQDRRVRVIHQSNQGVSASRNAGIRMAIGHYIQFVDSDDYLDMQMTEIMVNTMEESRASMLICGYKVIKHDSGQIIRENYFPDPGVYNHAEFLEAYHRLYLSFLIHSTMNKLYRADLIKSHQLSFDPAVNFAEDLLFNLQVIRKCQRLVIIKDCLYNYTAPWSLANLTSRRNEDPYMIEKRLFEAAISVYTDKDYYRPSIEEIEINYIERLVFVVVRRLGGVYRIKEYPLFLDKIKQLRNDEILNRCFDQIGCSYFEDKILKWLLEKRMYRLIFLYPRIKRRLVRVSSV